MRDTAFCEGDDRATTITVMRWMAAGGISAVIELIKAYGKEHLGRHDVSDHDGWEDDLPGTVRASDLWGRRDREVRTLR